MSPTGLSGVAVKFVADPIHGNTVATRSRVLRDRGLRTPALVHDAAAGTLSSQWLSGTEGRELLRSRMNTGDSPLEAAALLIRAAVPVIHRLHRMPTDGLELIRLDPWRRIRPRLPEARAGSLGPLGLRAVEIAGTSDRPSVWFHLGDGESCVHGDLHAGQLVIPPQGQPWILDLDDLAAGPPESDLGNFLAHLVTSPGMPPALRLYLELEPVMARAYASQGARPDPARLHAFAGLACLRRGLKGLELGWSAARVESAIILADLLLSDATRGTTS